jgi:hypothetical protein
MRVPRAHYYEHGFVDQSLLASKLQRITSRLSAFGRELCHVTRLRRYASFSNRPAPIDGGD